jgi:hypothetical protein
MFTHVCRNTATTPSGFNSRPSRQPASSNHSTPCFLLLAGCLLGLIFYPENGGSCEYVPVCTGSHPKWDYSSHLPLWEHSTVHVMSFSAPTLVSASIQVKTHFVWYGRRDSYLHRQRPGTVLLHYSYTAICPLIHTVSPHVLFGFVVCFIFLQFQISYLRQRLPTDGPRETFGGPWRNLDIICNFYVYYTVSFLYYFKQAATNITLIILL